MIRAASEDTTTKDVQVEDLLSSEDDDDQSTTRVEDEAKTTKKMMTGEAVHACDGCTYVTNKACNLRRHIYIVHDEGKKLVRKSKQSKIRRAAGEMTTKKMTTGTPSMLSSPLFFALPPPAPWSIGDRVLVRLPALKPAAAVVAVVAVVDEIDDAEGLHVVFEDGDQQWILWEDIEHQLVKPERGRMERGEDGGVDEGEGEGEGDVDVDCLFAGESLPPTPERNSSLSVAAAASLKPLTPLKVSQKKKVPQNPPPPVVTSIPTTMSGRTSKPSNRLLESVQHAPPRSTVEKKRDDGSAVQGGPPTSLGKSLPKKRSRPSAKSSSMLSASSSSSSSAIASRTSRPPPPPASASAQTAIRGSPVPSPVVRTPPPSPGT